MMTETTILKYNFLASLLNCVQSYEELHGEENPIYCHMAKVLFLEILKFIFFFTRKKENDFNSFLKTSFHGIKNRQIKNIFSRCFGNKNNLVSKNEFLIWVQNNDYSDSKLISFCTQLSYKLFAFLTENLLTEYKSSKDLEKQAQELLTDRLNGEYGNLQKNRPYNSSPDLVDYQSSLGVEVTRGLTPRFSDRDIAIEEELSRFAMNYFGEKIPGWLKLGGYLCLSRKARKKVSISKNGDTVCFVFIGCNPQEALINAINKKIEKLNDPKGSYRQEIKTIDLFVYEYGQDLNPTEEKYRPVFQKVQNFIAQRQYERKFRYILIKGDFFLIRFSMDGKIIEPCYYLPEPDNLGQ